MEDILGLSYSGLTEEDLRGLSTQKEWAEKIGVNARTIRNWQDLIIDQTQQEHRIIWAYYWKDRKSPDGHTKKKLDFYQKTLLFLISRLKSAGKTNQEIQDWFVQHIVFKGEKKKRIHVVSRTTVKQRLGL